MKAIVNSLHLMTANTVPSTSAANLTAITADGLALNTAHTISDQQGRDGIPALYSLRANIIDKTTHNGHLFTKYFLFFGRKMCYNNYVKVYFVLREQSIVSDY